MTSDYRKDMNESYWQGFIRHMAEHHPQYQFGSPSKERYQIVPPSLNTGVRIAAAIHRKREEWIHVDVTLTNTPPEWFERLYAERKRIEAEVGITDGRWEWEERAGKAESHIILKKTVRLDGARTPQYEWLADTVHKFHHVFGPRIASR
jgi:hypothetical protein